MDRIEGSEDINERNKEILSNFYRDLQVGDDCGKARIYKNLQHLKKIAEFTDVDLDQASEDDIKDIVMWIKNRDLAQSTKRDYKVILKRFYKWMNGGEYPDKVGFVKTTEKRKDKKLPEDLLTEEDISKLIENANHPRDRALIHILYETGARIGEIIDLQIKDLKDTKHGMKIVINGKTGPRRLPLITSVPHLKTWMNTHPETNNPEAWLWVNVGNTNFGGKMQYRSILKMLNETSKRAGIEKDTNPHSLRHARATFLATKLTEAQLCEWFGLVQGSDQPQRYVHMSGRDIDSTYYKMHGIEEKEGEKKSILTPKECPRCGADVSPTSSYCDNCAQALDLSGTSFSEDDWEELKPDLSKELQKDAIKHSVLKDLEDSGVKKEIVKELKDDIKHLEAVKELDEEN